jgi:hypothetical protein
VRKSAGNTGVPLVNDTVADTALRLALAWGEAWLQPIHSRLAALYPELGDDELDTCDAACRAVIAEAVALAAALAGQGSDAGQAREFRRRIAAAHPWITPETLAWLHSQASYYARR